MTSKDGGDEGWWLGYLASQPGKLGKFPRNHVHLQIQRQDQVYMLTTEEHEVFESAAEGEDDGVFIGTLDEEMMVLTDASGQEHDWSDASFL